MSPRRGVPAMLLAVLLALSLPATSDAQGNDGFDLSALDLPPGFLDLSDLAVSGPRPGVLVATATTTLMGNVTNALVSTFPTDGRGRGILLGLKPTDWSLTRTIPALANPVLDELTFQYVGLVLSNQEVSLPSSALSREERAFFRDIYQSDEFTLTVKPGINLIAAIPAEGLSEQHPLNVVMNALGIEKGVILIQGTLGKSLALIGAPGAGALDIVRDLYLRAELPPMRPPGSPEWFNSGQLALEITGEPSLRLVGEMSVNIQEDQLMFFVAATLARTGMSLSGGLQADDDGWQQPFGIEWLTINRVVLMLGITPAGSVQLGFAGDAVFGEKDITVAVAIAISAAGVPTNFMLEGESEAGVALADLAMVQERMARAVGRDEPRLPIDALPEIAITQLGLKFAPKAQPELGIERGMAIKGRLWLQTSPGGELTDFAGVDVNVGEDGLWVRGDIGAFELGPLALEDSKLDLTATREEQHLILKGAADLLGARQALDIEVSRSGLSFHSETRMWDLFTGIVDAEAEFNLRNPSFQVHAEMQNDFADALAPFIGPGLQTFAEAGQDLLAGASAALSEVDRILADREAGVERIREALAALRGRAEAAVVQARVAATAAQQVAARTRASANAAYRSFASTPRRYVGLRAQRFAAYRALMVRWRVQVGVANGRLALVAARQRILNAIPPVDENVLLLTAEAALSAVRERVTTMRTDLASLEQRYALVVDAIERGELPFTVERAVFDADLAGLRVNGSAQWSITGSFLGSPFTVERRIDFSDVAGATADLLQELIR